jgi:hypothetical protein
MSEKVHVYKGIACHGSFVRIAMWMNYCIQDTAHLLWAKPEETGLGESWRLLDLAPYADSKTINNNIFF